MEGRPKPQQIRRVCKYCNKSFPSGRSLGGHVRSHVMGYGLTQSTKKIRKLSDVDDRVRTELEDVALVLMMLREEAASSAVAEESSADVEEYKQFEEDSDTARRTRARTRRRRTDRDFSYDGGYWPEEAAAESVVGNETGRGSEDWYEPEKPQSSKKTKFQCNACKKVFSSYQALGGHRAAHKRTRGPCYVPEDDAKASREAEVGAEVAGAHAPPERKGVRLRFQCETCLKVFASGQALGGHMRSHLAVNCSDAAAATDGLFDLNSPALDDEDSGVTEAPYPVGKNSTTVEGVYRD